MSFSLLHMYWEPTYSRKTKVTGGCLVRSTVRSKLSDTSKFYSQSESLTANSVHVRKTDQLVVRNITTSEF